MLSQVTKAKTVELVAEFEEVQTTGGTQSAAWQVMTPSGRDPIRARENVDIELLDIDLSFGLTDDPVDENLDWAIVIGDFANYPLLSDYIWRNAIWTWKEYYRVITAVGFASVMSHDSFEVGAQGFLTDQFPLDNPELLMLFKSTTTSSAEYTMQAKYLQRITMQFHPDRRADWQGWNFAEAASWSM